MKQDLYYIMHTSPHSQQERKAGNTLRKNKE